MNPVQQAIKFFELRSAWLGEGVPPVPRDLAQKRANVCDQCPQNKPVNGLIASAKRMAADKLRDQMELKKQLNLEVSNENNLGMCKACDCVLTLKVHVDIKRIAETTDSETTDKLDERCWILKELNTSPLLMQFPPNGRRHQ